MDSQEIWKDVHGYEGIYKISNLGRILSLSRFIHYVSGNHKYSKDRILKNHLFKNGYYYVSLSKNKMAKRFLLHRLLAEHFIPNPNNYPCINHIDTDQTNNSLHNLEWCTHKQNMEHAAKNGLHSRGEKHYMTKLTANQVREIKKRLADGELQRAIGMDYGVSEYVICHINIGNTWKHIKI